MAVISRWKPWFLLVKPGCLPSFWHPPSASQCEIQSFHDLWAPCWMISSGIIPSNILGINEDYSNDNGILNQIVGLGLYTTGTITAIVGFCSDDLWAWIRTSARLTVPFRWPWQRRTRRRCLRVRFFLAMQLHLFTGNMLVNLWKLRYAVYRKPSLFGQARLWRACLEIEIPTLKVENKFATYLPALDKAIWVSCEQCLG